MILITYIPNLTYDAILEREQLAICNDNDIYKWIKNGTPIPDNATNGDVIKAMFDVKEVDTCNKYAVHFPEEGSHYFFKGWWNAPYQKGGKE